MKAVSGSPTISTRRFHPRSSRCFSETPADTHCFLWWLADDPRLGTKARKLVGDGENEVYFSAASSWEIAIKVSLHKLTLPEPPDVYVPSRLAAQGMKGLAIEHVHALRVASLPAHHQDPFDPLVVAQSQIEKLPVLTVDEKIAAYEVETIWAGHGEVPWRPPQEP